MNQGCLPPAATCHSYQPSASTRQRRFLNASRNDGFSASVSERALIMRLPIARSLAHFGTSPQCSIDERTRALFARAHGRHVLRRRNVVARLERGDLVEREDALDGLGRREERIAAAHGRPSLLADPGAAVHEPRRRP